MQHFDDPATYPRRILLAVTGLSPQIVNETVYTLAVERRPVWVLPKSGSSPARAARRSTTSSRRRTTPRLRISDFITEEVRAITADPKASLHVSIAGGRKTMGF